MDDLTVYSKKALYQSVKLISRNIGVEVGIKKCVIILLKGEKLCKSEGIS